MPWFKLMVVLKIKLVPMQGFPALSVLKRKSPGDEVKKISAVGLPERTPAENRHPEYIYVLSVLH